MTKKPYLPPSSFLRSVKDDEMEFSGSPAGRENLRTLIALTQDEDRANRDWAVFLLSQMDVDNEAVRAALSRAAADSDIAVRSEAILGLALRDPGRALPLLKDALSSSVVCAPVFEAAQIVGDPALAEDLRGFAEPSDDPFIDGLAREALLACGGA